MKILTAIALVLGLSACMSPPPQSSAPKAEVKWVGASGALQSGDLSSKANLMDFATLPHFYAIAPVERMRGEVTVFDSKPAVATIRDGYVHVSDSWEQKPPFLVYSQVARWHESNLPNNVRTFAELEAYVAEAAKAQGIDTDKPFAFQVRAVPAKLNFHVFNMPLDAQPGEKPLISYKTNWETANEPVDLLGFYSTSHQGVFIPAGSRVHIHMKAEDRSKAGHVDGFELKPGGRLYLPM